MSFLKSFFSYWRRRGGSGYQPVNNWEEEAGEEDMDDLMRMASEADSTDFPDGSLQIHDGAVFVSPDSTLHYQQLQGKNLCQRVCGCGLRSAGDKASPCLLAISILIIVAVSMVSIGLGYYSVFVLKPEPVIDKSIDSFSIPNHEAYIHYDALSLARSSNHRRIRRDLKEQEESNLEHNSDRLYELEENSRVKRSNNMVVERTITQVYKRWKMQVIYMAVGDENPNVFTEERLKMIHKIERDIIGHPRWKEFCLRDPLTANFDPAVRDHDGCLPLNSLLTYFFPSEDARSGKILYDGFGENLVDIESALHLAMNHDTFYYFVDGKINKTYQKSHILRTEVLFGAPLKGFLSLGDHSKQQSDRYKEFIITYVDMLSKASTNKVQVLYGGNELFDYEVESTFWSDVQMAIYAVVSIALLMFLMTSLSVSLTFFGLYCIVLSFPLAIFFYRVVFNIVGLGIMNGAAAFVIIGIGVDDVFVFINIFRQTAHLKSVTQRLKFTLRTAGVATFYTSFTTATAFASNIASSIPAVYEFGLFMSLIVSGCWITVFLIMPASLYLYAFWFEPLERACGKLCCYCASGLAVGRREQIGLQASVPTTSVVSQTLIDDDDVPLIQIENDESTDNAEDVSMLVLDQPQPAPELSSSSYVGRLQQYVVGVFVNRVVIRWRIPCIIVYLLIFVASVGMMTQLRPSSRPPQLFKPGTNLQRLLDLKANFSMIDNLHCDNCSALYNIPSGESSHSRAPYRTPQAPLTTHQPVTMTPAPTAPLIPLIPLSPSKGGSTPSKSKPSYRSTPQYIPPILTKRPTITTIKTTTTTTTTVRPVKGSPSEVNPDHNKDEAKSVSEGYDSCAHQNCNNLKNRPPIQSGATVNVVFGITGINRSEVQSNHVLTEFKGEVTFDNRFAEEVGDLSNLNAEHLGELCRVCHALANNQELVKNGSAQCLPQSLPSALMRQLNEISDCKNLPTPLTIYNHQAPAHADARVNSRGQLIWLAFAFESTVSKGESYFEAYNKYLAWENFIKYIKREILSKDSPLQTIYQTSEFWKKVLMEVVAVNSAVYSVVLSLIVCMCSVAIFTAHLTMLLVITITIMTLIGLVVAIFYMAGWQMGAVEAVSLSILVGSSVDYCVHLVEGYLLMGKSLPAHIASGTNSDVRRWRTSSSIHHIGASIISSALTTIVAAIPLTQTTIQPFSKFGEIVLINSSVAILYTLTLCVALLVTIAPARFVPTWISHLKALILTSVVCGLLILALYLAAISGTFVLPGPNGGSLFG